MGLLITYRNVAFLLISSMILSLLDQLQIFWQLYLIELLGLLTGLGLLELMLVFFTNLSLTEFQVKIFGLIFSLLSKRQLQVVLMESLHKNIQLMLEFLKTLFLVLHFSYYTLMTFLIMLSVILLSMLDDTTLCSQCDQASDLWH